MSSGSRGERKAWWGWIAWPLRMALLLAGLAPAHADGLDFQARVEAQEAIERVYFSHRIGARKPFDQAVGRDVIESKVRAALGRSAALAELWHRPITLQDLVAERERIERETHFPDRLGEIYQALDHDDLKILEGLIRPVLADRLAREGYDRDASLHDAARQRALRLRERVDQGRALQGDRGRSGEGWSRRMETVRRVATPGIQPIPFEAGPDAVRGIEMGPDEYTEWREGLPKGAGRAGPIVEDREGFGFQVILEEDRDEARVVTYRVPKVPFDLWWADNAARFEGRFVEQGYSLSSDHASRSTTTELTPGCGSWESMPIPSFVTARANHAAVWTGSEMIVWGGWGIYVGTGFVAVGDLDTGMRYDPILNSWAPTSMTGAPTLRSRHTAVWSGEEMIIWGGWEFDIPAGLGGRYNPVSDRWTRIPFTPGHPSGRYDHTAVWTGERMIVWGGRNNDYPFYRNTGGVYDPETNLWTATSILGPPAPRSRHVAAWTGGEMIVWGGGPGDIDTGGLYDPARDTWRPTTTDGSPAGRSDAEAAWTGSEMIVWGGCSGPFCGDVMGDGARYDPLTDTWIRLASVGAPEPRRYHSLVWTGREAVVWGGADRMTMFRSGGAYDPSTDSWRPTPVDEMTPSARQLHSAVWTGEEMILWGGCNLRCGALSDFEDTGGILSIDPPVDADGDGFAVCAGDCDDSDASVNPGAPDLPGNPLDEDCDGEPVCAPGADWKSKGEYIACVARVCNGLVREGSVEPADCASLIAKAVRLYRR